MPPSESQTLMAQNDSPFSAEPEVTPPRDPFATQLTSNCIDHEREEHEEWEYEYSNTETETYYVTLDLTTPNSPVKRRAKRNAGRGGSQAKWINPGLGRLKRKNLAGPTKYQALGQKESTETPAAEGKTPLGEVGNDQDMPGSSENFASPEKDPNTKPAEVQILDLHTENPIVSYDGLLYSCQWASNIGTELLFTEHDDSNLLPTLRNLPGGVDLLAASSARIISRSVTLETKRNTRSSTDTVTLRSDARGNDPTIGIPVGIGADPRRKDQARFLEKLGHIKKAKGEQDEVTILTQKRLLSKGWKTQLNAKRQQTRARLQNIARWDRDKDKVEEAKEKLAEMDREDDGRSQEKTQTARKVLETRGRKAKQRVSVTQTPAATGKAAHRRMEVDGAVNPPTPDRESMSMATPQEWEGDEDGEMYDEDMEVISQYEDEEFRDEDAPNEDEDLQMANA